MTRNILPYLSGVPHLHVNRPLYFLWRKCCMCSDSSPVVSLERERDSNLSPLSSFPSPLALLYFLKRDDWGRVRYVLVFARAPLLSVQYQSHYSDSLQLKLLWRAVHPGLYRVDFCTSQKLIWCSARRHNFFVRGWGWVVSHDDKVCGH